MAVIRNIPWLLLENFIPVNGDFAIEKMYTGNY